jgi:tetratricopeptide (TPR) repeat protein
VQESDAVPNAPLITGPWPGFWIGTIVLFTLGYLVPRWCLRKGWIQRRDGKTVAAYLIASTIIIAIAAGFYALANDSELLGNGSSEAACLTALGLLAGGVLVGFLFALPKLNDAPAPNPNDPAARLKANTNLEKVSDWLTTVITGLGLTQLVRMPEYLRRFSMFLAGGFASHASSPALAVAATHAKVGPAAAAASLSDSLVATALGVIIHFPIVGFLAGYIGTRTILTRAFDDADRSLIGEDERKRVDNAPQLLELPDPSADDGPSDDMIAAAGVVASAETDTLETVDEKASYARALTILGRAHDAVPWFQKALEITPNDSRLLEQYAGALYADPNSDSWQIVPVLKRALSLIKPDDVKSRARISTNLVLMYLYVSDGFLQALAVADAMDADQSLEKRPILFFYRACALGQLYTALKSGRTFGGSVPSERDAVRGRIFTDTQLAIRLQPTLRERFRFVTAAHAAGPDSDEPQDDDLMIFAQDYPDYVALLGPDPQ